MYFLYFAQIIHSSCFEIPEAAVNLQRRALNNRNNVKRLLKGEVYRLTGFDMAIDGNRPNSN
ncbi:MAG: hypothetical protein LBJ00_14815 [Planctomycetaceae bacterium]|nr:hypothetical protein [Planctomycetaceae bacterium]